MMKEKRREKISLVKIILRVTPLVFAASPGYFILNNLVGILHGMSHGFRTFMTQKVFDSVDFMVRAQGELKGVIFMVLALGVAVIASQVLNGMDNFLIYSRERMVCRYIGKKINEKAGRLSLIDFEDTNHLDDIKRAKEGIENCAELLSVITGMLTLYVPYFLFLGIYLYRLKPILLITLLIVFIPTALTQFLRVKVFADLADESAPIRREFEYYERCMGDREYFKETRMLGAFGHFKKLYEKSLKLLNKEIWKAEKKAGIIELLMISITLTGYMGILYLLFILLVRGEISVGAFGAIFASISFMFIVMEEIICVRMGQLTGDLGTIKNLIRFLDIPENKRRDIEIKGVPEIKVENVWFRYPQSKNDSLKGVSLRIKKGETIAIVGENGAGKTTLVKLLMGLYTPTEGRVYINEKDTSMISVECLFKNTSAVFQRYQKYKTTLRENISLSDMGKECSEDEVMRVLAKAGLEIGEDKFKDGYETMLSREFGGIDLSGGQWQRIAIGRGLYRKHNMIVLDEPTAAIDPAMETQIYNKFKEMAEGKTAIIVTHRLGSAKIADKIIVLKEGTIEEVGTHEELMKLHNVYAQMYEAQSKWYVPKC